MFRQLQSRIGAAWCSFTHESVMWPMHGHYECRTCGRRYPAFAEATVAGVSKEVGPPRASQLLAGDSGPAELAL